jgi:hypothetical protein
MNYIWENLLVALLCLVYRLFFGGDPQWRCDWPGLFQKRPPGLREPQFRVAPIRDGFSAKTSVFW